MSNSVDQRIVQMQFDNAQFERGIGTTLASLKMLDQGLQLKNGVSGLEGIDQAASGLNFSELISDVNDLNDKFSALGVVGFNAISRVSNAVMDMGVSAVKAFTVQPLTDGLDEYKLKMDSITTILSNTKNKGTTLEDVNATLGELNEYADQTIYNFAEMTRNIGTFTAAGVDLETSAAAIKGIANLAAMSGANSHQASVAMYQLSQALATGTVKLMDWNSVVNAGMGGQLFQNALIQTAEHLGTGAKAAIEAEGSFRESLKQGWLTSEVLTETLNQFTMLGTEEERVHLQQLGYTEEEIEAIFDMGDTAIKAATKVKTFQQLIDTTKEALGSGWATSWEYIIGNMEQAQELWSGISNGVNSVIDAMSKPRNDFLKTWNESGGWEAMKDTLYEIAGLISDLFKPLGEAFDNVFKAVLDPIAGGKAAAEASKSLLSTVKSIRAFVADSEVARTVAFLLRTAFTALFSVVKVLGGAIGGAFLAAFKAVGFVLKTVVGVVEAVLQAFKAFREVIVGFAWNNIIDPLVQFFTEALKLDTIGAVINNVKESFISFFSALANGAKQNFGAFTDRLGELLKSNVPIILEKVGNALRFFGEKFSEAFSVVRGAAVTAAISVFEKLQTVWSQLLPVLENVRSKLSDAFGTAVQQVLTRAAEVFEKLKSFVNDNFAGALERVGEAFGVLGSGLERAFSVLGGAVGTVAVTIFENLQRVAEQVAPILEHVKTRIVDAWNFVGEAFSNAGFSFDPIIKMFSGFGEAFEKFFKSIGEEGFSLDKLFGLFNDLGDQIRTFVDEVGPSFSQFASTIAEAINGELSGALATLSEWLGNVEGPLGSVTQALSGFLDSLTSFNTSFKFPWDDDGSTEKAGKFSETVDRISSVYLTFSKAVSMASSPFATASNIVSNGLKGIADGINEFVKSLNTPELAKVIDNLGKLAVMGGVGAGLYSFFHMINSLGDLFTSTKAVMDTIKAGFTDLDATIKAAKTAMYASVLVSVAVSIGILVAALYALTKMDLTQVDAALIVLAKIAAGLVVAMLGLSVAARIGQMSAGSIMALSAVLASVVAVLLALVGITALLGVIPEPIIAQGEAALAGIVTMLTLLMVVLGIVSKYTGATDATLILGEIGLTLAAITAVIVILGNTPDEVIQKGVGVVAGIAVILSMVATLVTLYGKGLGAGTAGLMELAASIVVIAGAITILSLVDSNKLAGAVIAVAVMIAVLTGFLKMMSKMNPYIFKETAASLIIFSVAVGILAAALAGLAAVSAMGGDLFSAGAAMVAMMLALSAAALALGKSGPLMIMGAKAMLIVAGAVTLLSAALIALSMMQNENTWAALGQLALVMLALSVAFGVVALAATALAPGLYALTAVLLGLAAVLIGFGAGALMFATAVTMMSQLTPESVDTMIAAFQRLCVGLWESKEEIAMAIAGIGFGITAGIAAAIPGIMAVTLMLIGAILAVLIAAGPLIGEGGVQVIAAIIDGFATGIEEHGQDIVDALIHLGQVVIEGLGNILSDGINEFNNWLYEVTGGLMGVETPAAEAGRVTKDAYITPLKDGTGEAASAAGSLKDTTIGELEKGVGEAGNTGDDMVAQLAQALGVDIPVDGNFDFSKAITQFTAQGGDIQDLASQLGFDSADEFLAKFSSEIGEGSVDPSGLLSQIDGQLATGAEQNAQTYETSLKENLASGDYSGVVNTENIVDSESVSGATASAAASASDAWHSNLDLNSEEEVSEAVSSLEQPEAFSAATESDANAAIEGFSSIQSGIAGTATSAIESELSGVSGLSDSAYSSTSGLGYYMMSGLADGIGQYSYLATNAAAEAASAATSAIAGALQINSPSKVTMRMGKSIVEGLAMGIDDNADMSSEAAEKLAKSSMDAMMSQVSFLMGLLDDIDGHPTITPILDLGEVEAGAKSIDSLFPGTSFITGKSLAQAYAAFPDISRVGLAPKFGLSPFDSNSAAFGNSSNKNYDININLNYDATDDASALARGVARNLNAIMDMRG
jgi:tape measure domain-containing protein